MGCCTSILKYLLFLTNFLVFALGIMMLVFSVLAYVDGGTLSDLINLGSADTDNSAILSVFSTASILIIVISCLVVVVSFFGCCGAIKENKCLLTIYQIVLICFLAAFIAGAVLGYKGDTEVIKDPLLNTLKRYDINSGNDEVRTIVDAWDNIQSDFKCCGVDTYRDWTMSTNFPNGQLFVVPASCCQNRKEVTDVDQCQKDPDNIIWDEVTKGCFTKLENFISNNQDYILWGCVGIIIVMVLSILSAFAVCCGKD